MQDLLLKKKRKLGEERRKVVIEETANLIDVRFIREVMYTT